ncbi:hypothetical protein ACSTJO_00305, partial [Vibrio parahaemolyticus]
FTCSTNPCATTTTISGSSATGAVTVGNGSQYIGGLVGADDAIGTTIASSTASGNVLAGTTTAPVSASYVGGLVGWAGGSG